MTTEPSFTRTAAPDRADVVPSSSRDRLVAAAAWLLLGLCMTATVGGALAQRSSVRSESRRAFLATSSDVASSMASALRRDTDFVATMRSTLASQPDMTNAQFSRWIESTQAMTRYPGGIGYAFTADVPPAKLDEFAARLLADPPPSALPTSRFTLIPPGSRPFYCLLRLSTAGSGITSKLPLGLDDCAAGIPGIVSQSPAKILASARDTNQVSVLALDAKHGVFGLASAVYRGGVAPATVAGRRAALVGWADGTFDGAAILAAGGGVTPGLRVEISHRNPGALPLQIAAAGVAASGSQVRVTPVDADGSWSVRVSGAAPSSGLSATAQFWIILLAGFGLSGLLFGFVRLLARSRGQALRQVARKTAELRHLALHDGLTGLPNRALILDRVEQALARARRQNSHLAVMFLDLDGFKTVNDTFGHAAGDDLLRAVSARLSGLLRDSDTVGRLGGDEFVVVTEGDSLDAGPEVIADRIGEVLATPFTLGETGEISVQIRTSIGIALGLRSSAGDLLRDADIALYEAKDAGRGRFVLFAPEMHTVLEQRLELENDLRDAIDGDQLYLVYQPTFDLAANTINGVEALLRWKHPTRGLVMPDEFIPVAEATGMIVPIGRWVLDEACHQGAAWQRDGEGLSISVNVSGRQLDSDAEIVAQVQEALTTSGLRPGSLTLEITETVLMRDAEASAQHLHALKALGVRIAIDDFGTGYSSLSYLRQFPVDALKIDRSFISGVASNPEAKALIHTLVQLGKSLGIETLAEGIEETSQLDHLQREACDSGQGYLFARPISAAAVSELIGQAHRTEVL
jgi:diguanylate cyclase (GGDEF)-like protein